MSASSPTSEVSGEGKWVTDHGTEVDDSFVASAPAPPSHQKTETSISSTPFADLSSNNTSDISAAFGDMGSTPHAKPDKISTPVDDDDEFSPSPAPAPAPTSQVKEPQIELKKEGKAKVPGLDLSVAASIVEEKDALHEPPPKRRGDRDTTMAVSGASAVESAKPIKPSKPAKPVKTPVSSDSGVETPSSSSDLSKMSIKERLKHRIEQKKDS